MKKNQIHSKVYYKTLNFTKNKKIIISPLNKNLKISKIRFLEQKKKLNFKNLEISPEFSIKAKIDQFQEIRIFGKNGEIWELLKKVNLSDFGKNEIFLNFEKKYEKIFFESEESILSILVYFEKMDFVEKIKKFEIKKKFEFLKISEDFKLKKEEIEFSENTCQLKKNIIIKKFEEIFCFEKKNFFENLKIKKKLLEIENFNFYLIEENIFEFPNFENFVNFEKFENFFNFLLKNEKTNFINYLLFLEIIQSFLILNIKEKKKNEIF